MQRGEREVEMAGTDQLDERKSGTSDEVAEAETPRRTAAAGTVGLGHGLQQQQPLRVGAGGSAIGFAVAAADDAIHPVPRWFQSGLFNQPIVFFSHNKLAPANSNQPRN